MPAVEHSTCSGTPCARCPARQGHSLFTAPSEKSSVAARVATPSLGKWPFVIPARASSTTRFRLCCEQRMALPRAAGVEPGRWCPARGDEPGPQGGEARPGSARGLLGGTVAPRSIPRAAKPRLASCPRPLSSNVPSIHVPCGYSPVVTMTPPWAPSPPRPWVASVSSSAPASVRGRAPPARLPPPDADRLAGGATRGSGRERAFEADGRGDGASVDVPRRAASHAEPHPGLQARHALPGGGPRLLVARSGGRRAGCGQAGRRLLRVPLSAAVASLTRRTEGRRLAAGRDAAAHQGQSAQPGGDLPLHRRRRSEHQPDPRAPPLRHQLPRLPVAPGGDRGVMGGCGRGAKTGAATADSMARLGFTPNSQLGVVRWAESALRGECRDCEAVRLGSERNNSRCPACRVKRNATQIRVVMWPYRVRFVPQIRWISRALSVEIADL